MLLSEYVEAIIKKPSHVTKSELQVDGNVVTRLSEARDLSEETIKELGMVIHWLPKMRRLMCGRLIVGQRTAVDWPEGEFKAPDYVGTVHTHPYRKKLGAEGEIGFSFQDFDFYGGNFPRWMPVSVNFVVSNSRVFLAVFRDITLKNVSTELFRRMNVDEHQADQYLMRHGVTREQIIGLTEKVSELQNLGKLEESARIERDFYRKVRGYLNIRLLANRNMIKESARAMRFEAYEGRLGGTLRLQSNKVYLR